MIVLSALHMQNKSVFLISRPYTIALSQRRLTIGRLIHFKKGFQHPLWWDPVWGRRVLINHSCQNEEINRRSFRAVSAWNAPSCHVEEEVPVLIIKPTQWGTEWDSSVLMWTEEVSAEELYFVKISKVPMSEYLMPCQLSYSLLEFLQSRGFFFPYRSDALYLTLTNWSELSV